MGTGISRFRRSITSRRSLDAPPHRTISNPAPDLSAHGSGPLDADLRTYEATYLADETLRNFDSAVQANTRGAIDSIRFGLDAGSMSLDSLSQVTESLIEMNHDVVKIILENKRDIWKNEELSDLVEEFLDSSLLTLDFCTSLDSCLQRARHIECILNVALLNFKDENSVVLEDGRTRSYTKTLEKLQSLRGVRDPFAEDFFKVFSSVLSSQRSMLKRLRMKRRKIDKKLAKKKMYRRISNVIFIAAFATILICSIVAAALAAPPVVTAVVAAATVPMASMGKWLNSIWKKYENDLKQQLEIVGSMQIGNLIVIKDLENIRVQVDKFQIGLQALITNAEFATQGAEEEVVAAVEEIKKEVVSFFRTIDELTAHAKKCSQETTMARTLIIRKVINHPSGGGSSQVSGMFS